MLAQPIDASTVILVRRVDPRGTPWQCFMVRRHVRSDFAADVFVFPGGKVDESDGDLALVPYVRSQAPSEGDSHEIYVGRALGIAAIRELFEEVGILLATRKNGDLLRLTGVEGERFARYRSGLQSKEITMFELAVTEDLLYRSDYLHAFSRWITPEHMPRRYDTRFFVAYSPAHQEPLHDDLETTAGVWIAPGDALDRFRQGNFPLVFATEKHLERMVEFPSIEQMIANTAAGDLSAVIPRMVDRGGKPTFLLPGDEGY